MRRLALMRARVFGLIGIVVGGFYTLLGVSLLLIGGKPIYLFQLVLGLAVLGFGLWRFLRARGDLARFQREYGPDAGNR